MIDSVNKFAIHITAIITGPDFKSEYYVPHVFRRNQYSDVTRV